MDSTFVDLARDLALFAKDTFNNVAPEVWELAQQKIMATIIGVEIGIGVCIFTLMCSIISVTYGASRKYANDACIVGGLLFGVATVVTLIPLTISLVHYLIATDYYVLLTIMKLIH